MKSLLITRAENIFSRIPMLSEAELQKQEGHCSDRFEIAGFPIRFEYDRQLLKDYFFWQMKQFRLPESGEAYANIRIWSGNVFDALYSLMGEKKTAGFTLYAESEPIDVYIKCSEKVGKVLFAWRPSTKEGWVEITPDSLERFMNLSHMLTPLLSKMCISFDARMLHSAAIVHRGEAVMIAGLSGTGKSTLAASCLDAGMDYVSDDTIIFRMADRAVFPICSTLHLSPGSLYRLPHLRKGVESGRIPTAPGRMEKRHLELSCYAEHIVFGAPAKMILFPTICEGAEPAIRLIDKNRALTALLVSSSALLGERLNPAYMKGVTQSLRPLPMYEYVVCENFTRNADYLKQFLAEWNAE